MTFACLAETLNISHAAERLHLSQPAVSGQLRLLQDSFGEALYRRSGRGVALTPIGVELANCARHLQQGYQQALTLRDTQRGMQTGLLRIGASTTPASYLLPTLLAAYRKQYPGIELSIEDGNSSDILERLPEFDLAFVEGELPERLPADVRVYGWRKDEVVGIVGADHPLAGHDSVSWAQAVEHEFIMRETGSGVRRLVEDACRQAGVSPQVSIYLAGVEGIKQAVRAGLGVGFVSILSMQHEDGTLKLFRMAPTPLTRTLSILLPHASLPSRVAVDFLERAHHSSDAPLGPRGQAISSSHWA
nr:LysR family transcriptional regulator [Alcaligenes phenolicus]